MAIRFTAAEKRAGEMAVREMCAQAREWYAGNDWFYVYVRESCSEDGEIVRTYYATNDIGNVAAFEDIAGVEELIMALRGDDLEGSENDQQWVENWFGDSREEPQKMTAEEAGDFLRTLGYDGEFIPENMTGERFSEIWNELVDVYHHNPFDGMSDAQKARMLLDETVDELAPWDRPEQEQYPDLLSEIQKQIAEEGYAAARENLRILAGLEEEPDNWDYWNRH